MLMVTHVLPVTQERASSILVRLPDMVNIVWWSACLAVNEKVSVRSRLFTLWLFHVGLETRL